MEKRKLRNKLFLLSVLALSATAALLLLVPLIRLMADAGVALLRSWGVLPGIWQVVGNTALVLLLVLLFTAPAALLITLWMYEALHGLRLYRVQRFLNGLSRVPAVLVGLLFHALLGGAARRNLWPTVVLLAVMCLPFLVSRLDAALRAVPEKYERAGTALGGSRMAVLWMVLLPQALPGIVRALLRLAEKVLCEATAVLALLCAVTPDSLLAPELFRLTWLGREDASVLAFALAAGMIALRLAAERRWRSEGEEANCRYNWW